MGRITQGWEALQSALRQSVETRQRRSRFSIHGRDTETVSPGADIADHWEEAISTAIVRLSLLNFAFDVCEPGLHLEGNDAAITYLEDEWLPQAGIIAGERHKAFDPILPMSVMQRWGRGGMMIEHVRADPSSPDSKITGVNPIRPETGKFVTLPNKQIIVEPADLDNGAISDPVMTRRDEPAAFIQWHSDALRPREDRDTVPLSINDFTRTVFSPGIGAGPMNGVWGRPVTATVADDIAEFKTIRRSLARAIQTKGWGLWDIKFGRDVLEYEENGTQVTEIIEWDEDEHDEYVEQLQNWDPGGVMSHDGAIEFSRLDSDVPDLIDELEFYVSNITAAMPTPKFVIGFEEDINQFVTQGQDARYELLKSQEQNALGTFCTELFKAVIEQNTSHSTTDLKAKIQPPEEESPILSLTDEEINRIATWMGALADASGTNDPTMLVGEELLRELILQLPDNSGPDIDEDEVDSTDPNVQDQIADLKQLMEDDANGEEPPEGEDLEEGQEEEPPAPADD